MGMNKLTTEDLKVGFEHFYDEIVPRIRETSSYKLLQEELQSFRTKLLALPGIPAGGRFRAESLQELDQRFDRSYRGLRKVIEGWMEIPNLPESVIDLLRSIRDSLFPSLSETRLSYVSEAALARQRRSKLEALRPQMVGLIAPDGRPFADYAAEMLDFAEALDSTLQARTKDELEVASPERGALRLAVIGTLGFLEESLRRECANNSALPRDLSTQAMAYFHKMAEMRTEQNRASRSNAAVPAAPASP